MAQQKYSLPDFAAQIRQKTGKGKQMTDTQLVREWVRLYPGDKEHLDDSTGMIGALETAEGLLGGGKPPTPPVTPKEPKPLPLEGEAAKIGTTTTDYAKNLLLEPTLPNPTTVNLPFLGKGMNLGHVLPNAGPAPVNPALTYKVARELSSPADLASLGSLGGASLAAKYGVKGLAKAAPLLDRGASAALTGIGASDVIDAATNSNSSPSDRLLQGGVGVLLSAAGMAGMRNPLGMPTPPRAVAPPVPPRLALPPLGGTTPTGTRFYAGPAGIADTTQQYPVHITRPTDPLIGHPDSYATPTPGEIGQMRDLPTIEAARGPLLSGLHGTGAPIPATPDNAKAIFERQIADILRNPPPPKRALPPATGGGELPRGNVPQTGTGGKVEFGSPAAKGVPPAKAMEGEVLPAPPIRQMYHLEDGRSFSTIDDAIDAAQDAGFTKIGEAGATGRVEWVPFDEGFARASLLRPLAGSLVGGAMGATQGDTPQERIAYGLLGAAGGGVLGAPRRAGRFVRDTAEKAYAQEPLPSFPPLPKVGTGEHAESVMQRIRKERGQVRFPRGTRAEDMTATQSLPESFGKLPDDFTEARKHIRRAMGQEEGALKLPPPVPARLERGLPGEPGYAYHATNADNLRDIATTGKLRTFGPRYGTDQTMWPDRATEKRAYFSATPENSYQFAPEDGVPVIVRTKRDGRIFRESTGDLFAREPISAETLEFLGQDQRWHPIKRLVSREEGFIENLLMRRMAGGAAGALAGGAVGETPEEKMKLALVGGVAGAALPGSGRKLRNGMRKLTDDTATVLNLPPVAREPLKAFHGTPHKFDKFDMSKIGTGEGAQAYGRGLYFAEDVDVARNYRDQLSGTDVWHNGRKLPEDSIAARYLRANSGRVDHAISELEFAIQTAERGGGDPKNIARYRQAQKFLEVEGKNLQTKRTGQVIAAEVKANPNHLIDWDKSFDEQPEYVRKKLAKILDIDSAALRAWSGRDIYKALARQESMSLAPRKLEGKLSTEADVVELLRKNGIKGIKYLDGSSRRSVGKVIDISPNPEVTNGWVLTYDQNGTYKLKPFGSKEEAEGWAARNLTPKGTSNYVVFDDKLIDIVGREEGFIENLLMRRMAGGAAGALTGGAIGETPEEKAKLAIVGGVVGAALPRGAARMPKRVPNVTTKGQDLLIAQAKEGTTGKDSILGLGTRAKRNILTRFAPQDALDDIAEKNVGRKLTAAERSGDTNRRVLGGQSGRVRAAMYDLEDVVKSTKDIDEEVRNYMNMKGMLHAHSTLLKKAGKMTGKERAELLRRLDAGEVFPQRFTKKELDEAVRLAEKSPQFARVKEATEKIFKFNRQTLDDLHANGLISTEGYEELVGRGMEYVPLFRRKEGGLIEDAGRDVAANLEREMTDRWKSAGLSLKQISSIKAIMGSERVTQDPYQASLYLRQLAEREIGRNEAAKTLYNLRTIDPDGVGKLIVPLDTTLPNGKKMGKKSPPPGYKEVTYREDGEVVSYAVPHEIADAQLLIDGKALVAGVSALGEFLSGGKGLLQATATAYNPVFTAYNVQRDFRTARALLKANKFGSPSSMVESLNEWRKALASRLKKDENFREALRSRALQGTLQETILPTPLVVGGKKMGVVKWAVNSVAELSRVMEETTKLMAYNQMKKMPGAGATEDIAKEVRVFGGSPDFADIGTKISEGWSLAFMFLNPAIQGIAQNIRGIRRAPGRAAAKLAAATGGAIALHTWNSQFVDENGEPEMEHVPKYDRDTAFVILLPIKDEKSGRNIYLSVLRKAHIDRLFYNATQDAIQMAAGDENISAGQLGMDVASQFLPGSVGLEVDRPVESIQRSIMASANPAFRIPGEMIGNRKAFEGVPIESQRLKSLPAEARYDSTTGKTYRQAGKRMKDVEDVVGVGLPDWMKSPKSIQHITEGIFNTPGRIAVGAIDKLQSPTSINIDELDSWKKVPLLGQLLSGAVRGGRDEKLSRGIDEIYSKRKETQENLAAIRMGRGGDAELAEMARPLDAVTRKLSLLRRTRESIISGEMQVDDPASALRELREAETQLVRQMLGGLTNRKK